jgi:hypothetical protein
MSPVKMALEIILQKMVFDQKVEGKHSLHATGVHKLSSHNPHNNHVESIKTRHPVELEKVNKRTVLYALGKRSVSWVSRSLEIYGESIKQFTVIVLLKVMPCRLVYRYPESESGFALDKPNFHSDQDERTWPL